jgi:hypothetical protein
MEHKISMFPILSKRNAGFKSPAGVPAAAGLAFIALMGQAANAQRAEGPFVHFAGSWSGAGTIATSNGTRERIRCVATYAVGEAGHGLEQNMRCASDSYKFYVSSNVQADGNRLSGTWTEATRGANGQVSGTVEDSRILATVGGLGFTASIAISTRGGGQSVTIRPSGRTDIVEVTVNLRKG